VVDTGPGVKSLKKGDHASALHAGMPRVRVLPKPKTNLCQAIRATQAKADAPDGSSRFSLGSKPLYHYMGAFHLRELHGAPEIAVAKIRDDAPSTRFATSAAG